MKYFFRSRFLFLLGILMGSVLQAQTDLTVLNSYKFLVIKPTNIHVTYSAEIKELITAKFKERGFTNLLDQSALYTSEYNPCDIITCEYNLTHLTGNSPELVSEYNFIDCNYSIVLTSKETAKIQFINEKNVLKVTNKHLAVVNLYTYTYTPKAPARKTEKPSEKNQVAEKSKDQIQADENAGIEAGKYFALLIGVSNYDDPAIPDLDNLPVSDAEKLAAVLEKNYTFSKEDISVLKNPTRREIVIALDQISKSATENDNVLIFYAGHGHYEDDSQVGYWLPKDAEVSNTSNWLYNDQLVINLKKIKSKHTLLISDACFSGSIFKSRSISLQNAGDAIKKKYELPSRKAITSGTLKTVPNVSIFMKYLLDRLDHNFEPFLSASQLFQSVEIPVGNNSPTTPQYGVIQNIGDEGGDFIFIKR